MTAILGLKGDAVAGEYIGKEGGASRAGGSRDDVIRQQLQCPPL